MKIIQGIEIKKEKKVSIFFVILLMFVFPVVDTCILLVTKYTSDHSGSVFYIYMFSALLFLIISSMRDNVKKTVFYCFLIYLFSNYSMYAILSFYDVIKLTNLDGKSHIEKMILLTDASLTLYSKSCWIFLIIAITSENIKDYLKKVGILLASITTMLFFGMLAFIIFLFVFALINQFINNKIINKITNLYIFFSTYLILIEFLIMFNIMTISFNVLTLMGFVKDVTMITDVLEKLKSFNFINYVLKGNLLEFTENIYKNDGYSEQISKDSFIYVMNQIRDKLSFMFVLIICLYKINNKYIINSFIYFTVLSIILFIINFIYFINLNNVDIYVFVRLIYNIFIYYIIYLIISFKIINDNFLRKNIIYILIVFVLYVFNYYFFNRYGINLFNYVIFYFLFKMKDNIDTYVNNKLFVITILLSTLIITLTTVVNSKTLDDFSKIYEISSFFICSIIIIFFTKTLIYYKENTIDKLILLFESIIIIYILKKVKKQYELNKTPSISKKYVNYENFIRKSTPRSKNKKHKN